MFCCWGKEEPLKVWVEEELNGAELVAMFGDWFGFGDLAASTALF